MFHDFCLCILQLCREEKMQPCRYKSCSLDFRICQSSRDLSCMQMENSICAFFLFKNTALMAPQAKPIFTLIFIFLFSKICGLAPPFVAQSSFVFGCRGTDVVRGATRWPCLTRKGCFCLQITVNTLTNVIFDIFKMPHVGEKL